MAEQMRFSDERYDKLVEENKRLRDYLNKLIGSSDPPA